MNAPICCSSGLHSPSAALACEGRGTSAQACCPPSTAHSPGSAAPRRSRPAWRRSGELAGWILPSAILVLLPKCPACLAAYVALFSGIGLSFAGASVLRLALLTLSVGALLWLAWSRVRRWGER